MLENRTGFSVRESFTGFSVRESFPAKFGGCRQRPFPVKLNWSGRYPERCGETFRNSVLGTLA
jgi:hypothetical protein